MFELRLTPEKHRNVVIHVLGDTLKTAKGTLAPLYTVECYLNFIKPGI